MRTSNDSQQLRFPDLEQRYGEVAVRDAVSTLHREAGTTSDVRDDTIGARIQGIDDPERIQVFVAVENRTRGRRSVLERLSERRQEIGAPEGGQ